VRHCHGMTIARNSPVALLVLLLVVGCSLLPGGDTPDLEGREFLSTSIAVDGLTRDLVRGTVIRLGFADGRLSANAGCNTYGATYRLEGDVLAVTDASTTEMGCDADHQAQDAWLFALIGAQPGITVNGDELVLSEGDTTVAFLDRTVAEPDLPLIGPIWTVTMILTADAAASVPEDVAATLAFSDSGQVFVNTGCNTGSGSVEVLSTTLRLGDIVLSQAACTGPAVGVERAMIEVLSADVVHYDINASQLTVSIGDRGLQLAGTN
jgi:heat shock protein HslJ